MSVTLATLEGDCNCNGPVLDPEDLARLQRLLPPDAQPVSLFGDVLQHNQTGERFFHIRGMSFYSPGQATFAGDQGAGYIELGSWLTSALGMKKKLGLLARISKNFNRGVKGVVRRVTGQPKHKGIQGQLNKAGNLIGKVALAPLKAVAGSFSILGKGVAPILGKTAKPTGAEKMSELLDMLPVEEPEILMEDPVQQYETYEQYYQATGQDPYGYYSEQVTTDPMNPDPVDLSYQPGFNVDSLVDPTRNIEAEKDQAGISPVILLGGAALALMLLSK